MAGSSKTPLIEPRCLKGFRDLTPKQVSLRQKILAEARRVAALGGYQEIVTPFLEYSEVLLGEGGETDKQVFRFQDHGDRDVALRYDLTVPFARYAAAQRGELQLPFRRLQIGEVFRGEKPQKGRYREFMQCDLDIIGADTVLADAEILNGLTAILSQATLLTITMRVGHRQILTALIQNFLPSIKTPDQLTQVLIALDKLDKIPATAVVDLIAKIEGTSAEGAQELLTALAMSLDDVAKLLSKNEIAAAEVARLRTLESLIQSSGHKKFTFKVDLSVARGLAYYTGVVFETTLDDLKDIGSICSGGRYNQLTSRFSSMEMAGVGGSIGVDRLLAAMEELGKLPELSPSKVFVAIADPSAVAYGMGIVNELRTIGVATEIAVTQQKLGKQLEQANKKLIPWVIIVGEDEVKKQTFSCKDMKAGREDKDVPRKSLNSRFKT